MDSASQSDKDWLLDIQRKLYQWSKNNPAESYGDLWHWITDLRNLRLAFHRVATNKGRNTAGIDGVTVNGIRKETGEEAFLKTLQELLRRRQYQPTAVRRHRIPKPGKPGKYRNLGIPTIQDRTVQGAIKQIIEPIFEARFYPVSHGFRPCRAVRDAIEHARMTMAAKKQDNRGKKIRPPYQWVIEGDIKNCFDEIDHHKLMLRIRQAIADRKVTRLILAFLKSGIMEECKFHQTRKGTPQGGILSPLLANVALSRLEERYARWLYPIQSAYNMRYRDRRCNRPVFFPIRYADDFIILCSGTEQQAHLERSELAQYLKAELGLELSQEKTKVTALEQGFTFLGHEIRLWNSRQWGYFPLATISVQGQRRVQWRIKQLTRQGTTGYSLERLITTLNPILRGWGNFYQHANRAKQVFRKVDHFVFERVYTWLRRKHPKLGKRELSRRFYHRGGPERWPGWSTDHARLTLLQEISCGRWDPKRRWLPLYAFTAGEPGT